MTFMEDSFKMWTDYIQTDEAVGWMFTEAFMQTVNKLTMWSGCLGIVHTSAVDKLVHTVTFTGQVVDTVSTNLQYAQMFIEEFVQTVNNLMLCPDVHDTVH